jgi:hypothetical protein
MNSGFASSERASARPSSGAGNVQTIKHDLVADVVDGYPENERKLRRKRSALIIMLVGMGTEAVLIGAALLVSITS